MPAKKPPKPTACRPAAGERAAPAVPPGAPGRRLPVFTNEGAFHEQDGNSILSGQVAAAEPRFMRRHADGFVRGGRGGINGIHSIGGIGGIGGIPTFVTAEHRRRGWKPAPRVDRPAA